MRHRLARSQAEGTPVSRPDGAPILELERVRTQNRLPLVPNAFLRDDFSSHRHPAPSFCESMIFSKKPVTTFRDHARDGATVTPQ
jgi:hypothetical protein